MHILLIFVLIPLLIGLALEYALCRFPKKRLWRWIPPAVLILGTVIAVLRRQQLWSGEEKIPLETLLFFPGLPVLALTIGLFLGFRLWKRLWTPQVCRDRSKKGEGGTD